MNLRSYFDVERGRNARLAEQTGLPPAYLSQMADEKRPVPPDAAPRIEVLTGYEVRRWDLRPADWHLIWPELVGSPGAPHPQRELPIAEEARDAA